MRRFDIAAGALALALCGVILTPSRTLAGIIQAIIPQAVPTANKRGNATVFQLAANTSSATAGTPFCDDGSGNATTSGCTGGGSVPAGSSIFNSTSSSTVTGTSPASLIGGGAATIPANTLITQDPLQTYFGGIYTIPGAYAGTLKIDLLIAGSIVATSGTITLPAAAVTNGSWRLSCQVTVRTTGVSGTAIYSCPLEFLGSSLTSLTPAEVSVANTAAFTVNTTISNTIDVQATWSTALGSPSITGQYATGLIGGAPVTSVGGLTGAVPGQGNGSKVQMASGSTTTGDFLVYDANGNAIDGGAPGTATPPYFTIGGAKYGPTFAVTPPGNITGQTTTLNNGGTLSSGATSMTVTSNTGFPTAPFIVQIGTEDIFVGASSGTAWSSMTRGYDGTSAASHTDGSTVTLLNFQWINQGTAVATATNGAISLTVGTGSGSANWHILKQIQPATAYTMTVGFLGVFPDGCGSRLAALFRESSTGKLVTFAICSNTGTAGIPKIEYNTWNSPTSFNGTGGIGSGQGFPMPMWLRLVNPLSGNRTFSWSADGTNFITLTSNAFNTFATPSEIGFGIDGESSTIGSAIQVFHFSVTTP